MYLAIATEKEIPYLKSLAAVVPGTYRKSQGMYIGEKNNPACKQNRNVLITASIDYNDTYEVTTPEQYKKNVYKNGVLVHSVGDFKKKKVCKIKVFKSFPNLSYAWAAAADFPTVSYGFTNWQRNALIIDSDQEYGCLQEAVNTFIRFAKYFSIPKPNTVLRNPKSKHVQAAWFLDSPFYTKDFPLFNAYTKKMANAYRDFTGKDADICFNGPACKNPYYKGFESAFLNSYTSNIDDFDSVYDYSSNIERLVNAAKNNIIAFPSSFSSYNNTNVTNLKSVIKSTSKSNHHFGDETSRDYWECKWLREWVWTYMRHNEHAPSYPEARKKMNEFAMAAAKKTGKTVHEFSELNATTKCTLNWAVKKFDSSIICGYNEKAADQGRLIHSLQSYVAINKICELKTLGRTCREIATMTGYSIATVSRAKVESISYTKIVDWLSYYREADDKYKEEYKQLFAAVINIYNTSLSSLSSYNNTNVTKLENNDIIADFFEEGLDWNEYCCKYYLLFGAKASFTDWVHYYNKHDYSHFRRLLAS